MRSVILEEEFAGKQSSEVDICGFCCAAGLCGRCSGACAAVVFSLRDGIFYTLKENFLLTKITLKMYLIENKEVTLLHKLNR